MKIRVPSPATGLSLVAVFVALGGTATAAGLVTGKQIRNNSVASIDLANNGVRSIDLADNSIRSIDVKDGTLRKIDFAPNELPAGEPGPQGPAGPAGLQGPQGPAGLAAVEIVAAESAVSSDAGRIVEAECPPGKQVIGGGAELAGGGATTSIALDESYPVSNGKWRAVAYEINATGAGWKLTAYAVCAAVAA